MKKLFTLFVAMTAAISMSAKTVYLVVNDDWKSFNAVFFVHSWGGTSIDPVQLTAVSEGSYVYSAVIPDNNNNLLFARMKPGSTTIIWDGDDKYWTKTADMEIPDGKDCFWLIDWTYGVWMQNGERPTVALVGNYGDGDAMWGANATNTMTDQGNGTAKVTLNLAAKSHEIKVLVAGYYMSLNGAGETLYQFNREYCQQAENVNLLGNSGRNFELVADVAGNYIFTWSYFQRNLVVTFPEKGGGTSIDNTDANTMAVKRIVNGQLVIEKNGKFYNALGAEVK